MPHPLLKGLKIYMVDSKYLRPDGTIDPKAPLLPRYARHYGVKDSDERLDTYNTYDDASTPVERANRPYKLYDVTNLYPDGFLSYIGDREGYDGMTLRRGYSAYGYASKGNRGFGRRGGVPSGDASVFSSHYKPGDTDMTKHTHVFSDTRDVATALGMSALNRGYHGGTTPVNDRNVLSERLEDSLGGANLSGFTAVPLIVRVSPEDVIRLKDTVDKGYDPWRDHIHEIQVRRILGRQQIPGAVRMKNREAELARDCWNRIFSDLDDVDDLIDRGHPRPALETIHRTIYTLTNAKGSVAQLAAAAGERGRLASYTDELKALLRSHGYNDHTIWWDGELDPGTPEALAVHAAVERLRRNLLDWGRSDLGRVMSAYEKDKGKEFGGYDMDAIMDAFRYDDPLTLSDEQYKFIIDDMYNDWRQGNTRPSEAVADACS